MNENEQMRVLAQQLWKNYMEPQIDRKLALTVRYFRAQVVSNPGNNTLEVQRPGDSNTMTLPCTDSMAGAAANSQCVVIVLGDLSNAIVVGNGVLSNVGNVTTEDLEEIIPSPPVILSQPEDVSGPVGSTVPVSVVPLGLGLTYQWQYQPANGTTWSNSSFTGNKTKTMTVSVTAARNGYKYRCKVTDKNGSTTTSNYATLTVTS